MHKDRIYVPNVPKIKLLILDEIHKTPYSGHPGYQKTITMLRKEYFWPNMKTELAKYISRCFDCQRVKNEHQHPARLLQLFPIPSWKWETISLDFVTRLPKNQNLNDSIMVVVDKLSKVALFIPAKTTYKATNTADIFLKQSFRLHGIPKVIISYRDPKFTGNFWKSLFKGLNTTLNFSTSFHPQTDGQTERVNQVLEDYIARFFECEEVKTEHQHPAELLQSLPIPSWKWEIISLDFITGLP